MALVATVGSKSANTMVSVSDADTYISGGPYPITAWTALTTSAKEYRLLLAAKYMASRLSFVGYRLHKNQAMPFPRAWPLPDPYPSHYRAANQYLVLTNYWPVVPSDADIQAMDYIPDEIAQYQALFAYGVIHRGLQSVSDPADGPSGELQVKEIDFFKSFRVTAADKAVPVSDISTYESLIRSEHFHLRLLIENWVNTQPTIPGPRKYFELDEVA
jgi:hypothetical protein